MKRAHAGWALMLLGACTHDVQLPSREGIGVPTGPGVYEAELAFRGAHGVVSRERPGFSGAGYVDGLDTPNARLIFAVHAVSEGEARVRVRHAGAMKALSVAVNGAALGDITLPASEGFVDHVQTFNLRRGLNTVALAATDDGERVSIDAIALDGSVVPSAQGARVAFVTFEAEDGQSNAGLLGPDTTMGTVAANASGRRAVQLEEVGDYVRWTVREQANVLSLRFSLPDAPAGGGTEGSLSLYVDGDKRQTFTLSSRRAWLYGDYQENLGFRNDPAAGASVMPFIEERFVVDPIAAGSVITLQRDAEDGAEVTIDLIDLELAPSPYVMPLQAVSIVDKGAISGDDLDDSQALIDAILDAKGRGVPVWIPAGEFRLAQNVSLDQVTVRGAGPHHTTLRGTNGIGGFVGAGGGVQLLDLRIVGDQDRRDDLGFASGIDGSLSNALLQNLWIESTKGGIWLFGTDSAYVVDVRIRDTYADGLSFNENVSHAMAEHIHVRGSGDDGLAMWARGTATSNRFRFVTVRSPWHKSGIALYGGTSSVVEDCEVFDTVRNGAGIALSTQFAPIPFGGEPRLERIDIVRAGSLDPPADRSLGALDFRTDDQAIDAAFVVRDVAIEGSPHDGLSISGPNALRSATFEDVSIEATTGHDIYITSKGDATFTRVTVRGTSEIASDFVARKTDAKGW